MNEDVTPQENQKVAKVGTVPIYDISGDQATLGEVPHDDVQAAVVSGKYSLPKGRDVQVIAPDGSLGSVPAEDAENAFKSGYKYATPTLLSQHQEKQHFESTPQKILGGLEAVSKGVVGPLAPLAEKGLTALGVPGLSPEEQRKREEHLGIAAPIAEAAGFVGSMLTGVGEAALLERAGVKAAELASQAIAKGVAKSASQAVAARLAAGSARMATEMGIFQAGDEAGKIINDVPTTPGQVASNIGLSTILGGVGGGVLTGLGVAANKIVNNQVVRDFADRMAYRGSNLNAEEKVMQEFETAQKLYHEMGSEVGGATGIRAQAMEKLIPETNEHIIGQAQDLSNNINKTVDKLAKSGDKSGMVEQLQRQAARIEESFNPRIDPITMQPTAQVNAVEIYDAINQVKRQLGEWGKFNKAMVPLNEVEFRNSAKSLGYSLKTALEDEKIWGKAGGLQKEINAAWHEAIPAMKDAESKFMTKVGDERIMDPAKFATYFKQSGKATEPTIRQQMMGNFIEAVDKFHGATAKAYEAAGIENPFQQAAMTSLKDTIQVPSVGAKIADKWFDKLAPTGLGEVLGGLTGGGLGHATGIPDFGILGGYLGKWALGPVFSSVIKPIMEHGPNNAAFQAATGYAKAVLEGNARLTNSAAKLFESGAKTVPSHFMPTDKDIKKLDAQVKEAATNPSRLFNVAANMEDYMPGHAQALSQTAMTAVNYLSSIRPQSVKKSPLDKEIPPSKAQEAAYVRQLEIAQQPLLVFQHMKDGTLQAQDIQTLKTIYPDYYNKMSQQVMTAMTDHLSKDEHVPYKLRQSASLFLGQALDSTMTPASIQSIQAGYAAKSMNKQQAVAGQKVKKGTSKLGQTSENMLSANQARQQRSNQA